MTGFASESIQRSVTKFDDVDRFVPVMRKRTWPLVLSLATVTPVMSGAEPLSPAASGYCGPPSDEADGTAKSASAAIAVTIGPARFRCFDDVVIALLSNRRPRRSRGALTRR